tara:strand:- start:13 stop:1017 length:1005 start_codon:yes stop_codon:yes gene_type:complete
MNIKTFIWFYIAIFIFNAEPITAQIQNGNYYKFAGPSTPFSEENLKAFKKTKTIFLYEAFEEELVEEVKEKIIKIWTITDIQFVPVSKKDRYLKSKNPNQYSFFFLTNLAIINSGSSKGTYVQNFRVYRDLFYYRDDTKYSMGQIHLNYTRESYVDMIQKKYISDSNFKAKKAQMGISKGVLKYHNYSAGHLFLYMKLLHKSLLENEPLNFRLKKKDLNSLKKIAKSKLIVHPSILIEKNLFKKTNGRFEESELFEKYDFNYEVLESSKLEKELLKNHEEDKYVLLFFSNTGLKLYQIVNLRTMEIVFSYSKAGKNAKSKDLKKLNKAVVKATQ